MKKSIIGLLFQVFCFLAIAQPDTDIYLFDLKVDGDSIILSNKINISNNDGYDNQPSFFDDETILFSSTRNGQTDVRQYSIKDGKTTWLTDTPVGSEYSPTRIPNSTDISAIRLDTTGLQRLYRYNTKNGNSKPILKDAKVGYHLWYSESLLVNTVLVENRMDLVLSHLNEGNNYTVQKSVGRNLLKLPNSNRISYVSKEGGKSVLKSMDVQSGQNDSITTVRTVDDFAWTSNGLLLAGYNNMLMKLRPDEGNEWQVAATFIGNDINNITRIAINESETKLVLVAEISPEHIVQKQVDSYNAHDLNAFVSCYDENVWVGRFPTDTMYTGRQTMLKNYEAYLESVESTEVKVTARIVIGNKVIDQELATDNGNQSHQVAIYEVKNGRIASMNFIFDEEVEDPEPIVQQQLDAYNNRDIDGFMDTYTENVELYNYPNTLTTEGAEKMRPGYQGFFESTPDLHCEIKNRIVIGNKVIDEEYLTVNGRNFSAVAIYEVEDGKISKVTFVQ